MLQKFFRFGSSAKISARMRAFNKHTAVTCEKDCPCAFAQDHSAILLPIRLNRRGYTKQTPSTVSITQQPIDLFGPDDQAIVQRLTLHELPRHFDRCEPNCSVSHERVSNTGYSENRRKMACRRVEHCFWEQERTGRLSACVHDVAVETFRINDASIRDGEDQRNPFRIRRVDF